MTTDPYLIAAIEQARKSLSEGGIPIGSVLVHEGKIIGQGHNCRVQTGSAIDHGEMNCLRNAGRLPASAIEDVKDIIETHRGPAEVVLEMVTSAGTRVLRLGEAYRVQHTPGVRAELEAALAPTAALAATG